MALSLTKAFPSCSIGSMTNGSIWLVSMFVGVGVLEVVEGDGEKAGELL